MDERRIKKSLLSLKAELQAQEDAFQETNKPLELDQARLGRLSRMDAMQVQEMELETSRRRVFHITKIDGALIRLKEGEYGYCYACGEELDERRLQIDQTTTRCLACAG